MKRRSGWWWLGGSALVLLALVALWLGAGTQPEAARTKAIDGALPPVLLPASASENPPKAWQRLLAENGSPREDLISLRDLVDTLLHSVPPAQRPPLGFDEDLARALSDPALMGEAALPRTHPALRAGRLIDRWGTPWHVHPLAGDLIQLRSAGPDRTLFTADDLVSPEAAAEPPPV